MSKNFPFLGEQQKPGMPGAVLAWVPGPGLLQGPVWAAPRGGGHLHGVRLVCVSDAVLPVLITLM